MGGKGSGRRGGVPKEQNPLLQSKDPTNVDTSVNSKVMRFGRALMEMDKPDYNDVEAVRQRIDEYLRLCDEIGVRPMVNSLAQALGMDRRVLWSIGTGSKNSHNKIKLASTSADLIKKAYDFLQTSWEIYLTEEKGNPVKWFFLAKNYFGYEDQTIHVQRQEVDTKALPTPEEVAARYALQVGKPQEQLPEPPEAEYEIVEDD